MSAQEKKAELVSVLRARDPGLIGRTVRVQGWIRTRRDAKGFSFLELNDGSCNGNLQVIAPSSLENYESEIKSLGSGCSVSVEGAVQASGGAGQSTELTAQRVSVHGWADAESYPIQKKRTSFEKLREWAHLRPRTNTFGAVARVRNCVCNAIHRFFQEQGFLYVHTPIITASDCEGAGQLFQVTTLKLSDVPLKPDGVPDYAQDFFQRPTYLTVSGQLEAETYACALGKVYTFGPTFRAENSNTSRHLAEFWMIEPEMAFCELPDNMDLAEQFLKRIFSDTLEQCGDDMAFFAKWIDPTVVDTLTQIVAASFQRIPYTAAVEILAGAKQPFQYPVQWGLDLQSEHERFLTEEYFKGPVILYDYPRTIKPFYMYCNEDGTTVRAMDVLVPKVGEIIGGSQREHRLELLQERMIEHGLDLEEYWWYLDLRRFGTVPHSGFGLGLGRLVQFITGMGNIRDVIPFPRTPGNAEF